MSDRPPSPIDRAFLSDDPAAGQLILIRHGQQEWPDPETSTVGDWRDPPLSGTGRSQAEAVGKYLAEEPISAIYSSGLKRAHHTGLAVAGHHQLEVTVIDDLEEIHLYGKLPDGVRPVDAMGEITITGARERFVQTRSWDSYPASEPAVDFRRRVGFSIEGIVAAHPGETVAVACHAGVINTYLADQLDLGIDMFFRPAHASVHRVRFKGPQRVIHTLNEHGFLSDHDLLTE